MQGRSGGGRRVGGEEKASECDGPSAVLWGGGGPGSRDRANGKCRPPKSMAREWKGVVEQARQRPKRRVLRPRAQPSGRMAAAAAITPPNAATAPPPAV